MSLADLQVWTYSVVLVAAICYMVVGLIEGWPGPPGAPTRPWRFVVGILVGLLVLVLVLLMGHQ